MIRDIYREGGMPYKKHFQGNFKNHCIRMLLGVFVENVRKFMKVSNEFSNSNALGNLPQTKIFALLDVAVTER